MSYHTKNTQAEFPNYGFDLEVLSVLNLDTDCSSSSLCRVLFVVGFDIFRLLIEVFELKH